MPRYNFDLSEYQQPEFEFPWEGCSDLSPTHLPNYVSYFSETKTLHISVEGPQEYDSMLLLYESKGYPTPAVYLTTPTEDEVNSWHDTYQQIREKFGTAFQVKQPFLPFGSISERRVNAFSGTEINLPLGEGILNFCYADFNSAFEHCLPAYQKLMQVPDPPAKIQSAEEGVIHLFELYVKVFPALSEVFYSSLYTSVFLPQFTRATELAWEYYRRYLLLLQEELLELIEFCFDKEYRPDVLERLYPSERYSLWCSINGVSSDHIRQEIFHAGTYAPNGIQMPFGTDLEEVQRNLEKEFHLTPEQRAFAEENALSEEELWFRYQCPCFASTSYSCDNLRDMLYLEFTKILENMAEILGVQQSRINRYETGQSTPSPEIFIKYADYFDVSMDYLYCRTDEPRGKLYDYRPQALKEKTEQNREMREFIEMCFDPQAPVNKRLKEALLRLMTEGVNEE